MSQNLPTKRQKNHREPWNLTDKGNKIFKAGARPKNKI